MRWFSSNTPLVFDLPTHYSSDNIVFTYKPLGASKNSICVEINTLTVTLVGRSLNYHTSVNCKEMQNQTEQVQHTKHNPGAIYCKFCEQNIIHIFNAVTYKCHKAGINTHVSLHKLSDKNTLIILLTNKFPLKTHHWRKLQIWN